MTTTRKTSYMTDGLSSVRYTPASMEEDPEDLAGSDSCKLAFISCPGTVPVNGDVGRTFSTSTAATTSPPPSSANSTYPAYYDFQDTDDNDESEGGSSEKGGGLLGLDSGGGGGGGLIGGNGSSSPKLADYNHDHHKSTDKDQHRNNNHSTNHNHLHTAYTHQYHYSDHNSLDKQHRSFSRHSSEVRDSRDLSKSPLSHRRRGEKERCMCCMMCIFFLSTAGLGTVLAMACAGKVQLGPSSPRPRHSSHANGGFKIDRLGDEKVIVESCQSSACMETAAAIVSRMNMSADPCSDFYNYACGGYSEQTYLSWFSTRVRESAEEIIQHYRRYAIDLLSSSYRVQDSPYLSKARTLFRSCLFRPTTIDERTRALVAEIVESLGGLTMPESSGGDGASQLGTGQGAKFDITPLVANVTRLYGASPFFRVIVHGHRKISIVSRLSGYRNPLRQPNNILSRSVDNQVEQDGKWSRHSMEQLLTSLLARTNHSNIPAVVQDYIRLEANIRRILKTDDRDASTFESDPLCDETSRRSFSELQFRYGGYGINWTELVRSVLDLPSARDVIICEASLSGPLQHLLEITPKQSLWQFAILHTLVHSDLFLLASGQTSPYDRSSPGVPEPFSANTFDPRKDGTGTASPQSPEEQCLDLVEYVMPNLKNSLHCDKDSLDSTSALTEGMMEHLRLSLYGILKDLFHTSNENTWKITNATINKVKMDVLFLLKGLKQDREPVKVSLDEYDYSANVVELVKFRNNLYFSGLVKSEGHPPDLTAFGIRACFKDTGLGRPGPILYHSGVSHAVSFGSLGSFLAAKLADSLGFEDLLDHYTDGVLNHSAVLGLAVKLQCFVAMYSNIELLDYGTQVYKVDGERNKGRFWKDQLSLQMIMMAWRTFHNAMTTDKALPGLPLTRDQLFYVAYAQTQCEKVSERGILQHYVSQHDKPSLPSKHRVNGPVKNLHDFYRVFHCGSSRDVCELF